MKSLLILLCLLATSISVAQQSSNQTTTTNTQTTILIYKGSTTLPEPTNAPPPQNANFKVTYFEVTFPTLSPQITSQFLIGNISTFRNEIRSLLQPYLSTTEANQVNPIIYRQGFFDPSSTFFGFYDYNNKNNNNNNNNNSAVVIENIVQHFVSASASFTTWKNVSSFDYFSVIFYLANVFTGSADDKNSLSGANVLANKRSPLEVSSRISGASMFGVKYFRDQQQQQLSYPESGKNDFDSLSEISRLHTFPREKLISRVTAQTIIIIVCASFSGLLLFIGVGLFCCSKRIKIVENGISSSSFKNNKQQRYIASKPQPQQQEQTINNNFGFEQDYIRDSPTNLFNNNNNSRKSSPTKMVVNPFSPGRRNYSKSPTNNENNNNNVFENNLKAKFGKSSIIKTNSVEVEKQQTKRSTKSKWDDEEDL